MGAGKTLIALSIIKRIGDRMPALVVCSKSLVSNWITEINKFFGNTLTYVVYHMDYMTKTEFNNYVPTEGTDIVITTSDVLSIAYKENWVEQHFMHSASEDRGGIFEVLVNRYIVPTQPILSNARSPNGFIYSIRWKCLIVDEVQQYTNIETYRCRSIASVFAKYRWATSGTPLYEPKVARVLGYYMIIGDGKFPNCMPDADGYIRSSIFPGLNASMVIRTQDQLEFTLPACKEVVVYHTLSPEEIQVYTSLKEIIRNLLRLAVDNELNPAIIRSINSQLLSMLVYAREFSVCPLLPFSNIMVNGTTKNDISRYFNNQIRDIQLDAWLKDKDAARSTRIIEIEKAVANHQNERCIVFSCFSICLNVINHYLTADTGRPVIMIQSKDSIGTRARKIEEFEATSNGLLLLTYGLGAEGLNLQKSHVLLLTDVWWNDGRTAQAIARVVRRGQQENVTIYLFTSNTGLESGIFNKHIDKTTMLKKLATGKITGNVKGMSMRTIMTLIAGEEMADTVRTARGKPV